MFVGLCKIAANGQGLAKAGKLLLCPPEPLPNKVVMINLVEKFISNSSAQTNVQQ
jgi:hypothetical protein